MKVTFKKDEYVLLDDTNKIIANYIVTKGAKGDTGAGEDNIIEDVKVNNNSLPVTSKSVNIDLTGYVEKETGKGLSTNDYTTAEKTKLAGIEASADVNVIENIKVNGVAQTVTNKAVDISVPINTSDLTNDSDFVTSTDLASHLVNVGTEVDEDYRVNFIRQVNNILPKGTIYTLSTGSVSLNFKVPKANTQYTMKTNLPETTGLALVFFGSGADAQVSSDVNGVWVGSPRTMTSDANGYVTIAFRYLSGFSSIKLSDYWYTLAEGTLGVDYIVPSINVDGEEIYSKGTTIYDGGTTGSDLSSPISFSDSLANYERIEIYYGTSRPYYISTFYSNYGQHQYFEPSLQFYYLNNADSSFYIYITLLTISQSAMELHSSRGSRTVTISSNGTITNTKSTTSSTIKIYKVIGYK